MIACYDDFVRALLASGLSLAGGNPKGIYSVIPFSWEEQAYITDAPIRWHTGDPETDPWEWRMRVVQERQDIAYAKLFFRLGGYVTRDRAADLLSIRREGDSFQEAWEQGRVTHAMKRIYDAITRTGPALSPELKREAGFGRGEGAAFEQALTDLQMQMFLTICGQGRRRNRYGEEYGWNCARFCTVEQFWGEDFVREALVRDPDEAEARLTAVVRSLNPRAETRAIQRFLRG